jgi:dipeptidyl aminopeptidase/acylaminoacyl peptidase
MKRFGLRAGLICGFIVAGPVGGALKDAIAQSPRADAGKRPMTFTDLMAMKRVSDPQISPSGKWVLFSVMDVSLEKNTKTNHLWVVPLNPSTAGGPNTQILRSAQNGTSKERQVTSGDGETNGRFSPDGKWVSMTMKEQLYVAPWDEATGKVGEAKALTSVTGGADGAVWAPDSKRLIFTAQVYPECSVKGGDEALKKLEPADGKAVVGGTVHVPEWKNAEPATWEDEDACDKAKDEAAEKNPVKGQIFDGLLYRHWEHWTGGKRSHIFVVDADGKKVGDLTPASVVGDAETPTYFVSGPTEYAWAPDSKEIAYVTNLDLVPAASTNNDVFTLRLDEPAAKAVKVSTSPGSDDEPEYSPDGKWLAFRSQARNGFESDKFRLMLLDREKKTTKDLMPKLQNWVDEFTWAPNSERIYFTSGEKGEELPDFVSTAGRPSGGITPDDGDYSDLRISPDGKTLVCSRMTVDAPAEVSFVAVDDDTSVPPNGYPKPYENLDLTVRSTMHINQRVLENLTLAKLEPFWFAGAEETKVQGFLLKPPNFDPAKKYPVKFLMHGGPQTAWGDAWSYRWNWELFASSGYVVIGINRRGSTGYGQKFVDEVSGDWGGRAYEDLMKGLDYAEAKYPFIDKNRECALGASYGGFMANWVLTHTNRFKCIVTHDGLYDPAAGWGNTEEMWFNEWEFRTPQDYPAGWDGFASPGKGEGHAAEPWRYQNLPPDQDPFRKWSAMRFIENAKTPTLVIHSQRDYRLDVSQGFEMFSALQRLGVPSKMLYFPDEGHWVLKPKNSELWNAVVSDWCDRWTHSGKYAENR